MPIDGDFDNNYVDTMDRDLLSRRAQYALKQVVERADPVTGVLPPFGGAGTPSNLALGANDGSTLAVTNSNGTGITLPAATAGGAAGLLSTSDKSKLDSLSKYTYNGAWAGRPGAPALNEVIRVTDVHPMTAVDFIWNGNAWMPLTKCPAVRDVYVQPVDGSAWASRPNGLVISIPVWATTLKLNVSGSGGGGGSGRRGAAASARAGGQGGTYAAVNTFFVGLRNANGTLIAPSATLTCASGSAGGASVTTDNTNGNAGGGPSQSTLFVLAGVTYRALAGGSSAAGGASSNGSDNSLGINTLYPQGYSSGSKQSVTAGNVFAQGYFATPTASGGGGGGIDTTDALVGVSAYTNVTTVSSNLTVGLPGTYQILGDMIYAVPPTGGAASTSAAAQAGGQGLAGCGGAGGGASLNGFASGAGGKGGDGWAILVWE